MKYLLFLFFCCIATCVHAQSVNPGYDSILAKRLQADAYGMKPYVLVILKSGPNSNANKSYTDSCFKSHMENINRLVKAEKLVAAGPIKKNEKNYRGIFIMNVKTFEEAQQLMKNDAAIDSGILEAELYQWYGSAALPEYLPFSEKISKFKH